MTSNFWDVLETIWVILMMISVFVALISFVWAFLDAVVSMWKKRKIKRDIRVWRKPLPREIYQYLSSLSEEIIEKRKVLFSERIAGCIRVENKEVLIQYKRPYWSSSWSYDGYVDLSEPEPMLQYRSSLPLFLFFFPFAMSGVLIPYIVLFLLFNHYMESTAIDAFLKRKTAENMLSISSTFLESNEKLNLDKNVQSH